MALTVLGYKVVEIIRKEHERRQARNSMQGQDITDRIADKVKERLMPEIDEKFDEASLNSKYNSLKETYIEIFKNLLKLNCISNNLEKYYSTLYSGEIKNINDSKNKIINGILENYEQIKTKLNGLTNKKEDAQKIEKIKYLNLFSILYRYTKGSDQKGAF